MENSSHHWVSGVVVGTMVVVLGIRDLAWKFLPPEGGRVEIGKTERVDLASTGEYIVYGVCPTLNDGRSANQGIDPHPAWHEVSESIALRSADDGKASPTQIRRDSRSWTATSLGMFRVDRPCSIEVVTSPSLDLPRGSYLTVGVNREARATRAGTRILCGGVILCGSIIGAGIVAYRRTFSTRAAQVYT